MSIGEQINSLRKRNSLSQDDFANMFHVSRQTISNWENGKSYPDLEMIIKISNYFKKYLKIYNIFVQIFLF